MKSNFLKNIKTSNSIYPKYLEVFWVILLIFSVHVADAADSQTKIVNQDIVKMVKAGLTPDIILQTIKASECHFDLSPEALIALKQQEVPDAIIQAMLALPKNTEEKPQRAANVPKLAKPIASVMLLDGANQIPMDFRTPEHRSDVKEGAQFNLKSYAVLGNRKAELRIKNTSPEFDIPLPTNATAADLVSLVKLNIKGNTREIETSKAGAKGVVIGIPKNLKMAVHIEETGAQLGGLQKVYRIKITKPVSPGEYAITLGDNRYYDFGVDN